MPIMYVNPARGRRRKVTKRPTRSSSRRSKSASRKNPSRKKSTTMARTKRRRKATTVRRRKTTARRKRRTSAARRTTTRRRKRRSAARRTTTRRRKRRTTAKRNPTRRRRRRATTKRNPTRRRRRRATAKRNPSRRRRRVSASRRRNPARRRRTSSRRRRNPSRRGRYARRYRRNSGGAMSIMKIMTQHVVPVVASLYVSRLISGKLSGRIPGMNSIPAQFRQPALAAILLGAGHLLTGKKTPIKMLQKHRIGIMTGLGINLVDKILGAFAPENVKAMFGVSDSDIYGPSLEDYVSVNDYMSIGATPIDDDITLADYVQVGDYEEDLGMEMDLGEMYSDMGSSGGFADRHLGGVHRNQMLGPVGHAPSRRAIPARSFQKPVPAFNADFDNPDRLYTGIFGGGY